MKDRNWHGDIIRLSPEEAASLFAYHVAVISNLFCATGYDDNHLFVEAIDRLSEVTSDSMASQIGHAALASAIDWFDKGPAAA